MKMLIRLAIAKLILATSSMRPIFSATKPMINEPTKPDPCKIEPHKPVRIGFTVGTAEKILHLNFDVKSLTPILNIFSSVFDMK